MDRCSEKRGRRWSVLPLTLILLLATHSASSYKILMVFPSFSPSHLIIATAPMRGLAEAGHEVTVVSSFPQKEKIPNYRDVYLEVPASLKSEFNCQVIGNHVGGGTGE